ncbi:MAG TPA: iron dicitrate transport regulator FecR, partial [Dyadobacter sp.]|nr:iron dicitrate transport regulator FecR [Dyadobacter sp.]
MNTHDQIPEELLVRYLARTASESEIQQVQEWLAVSDERRQEFEGYRLIWQQTEKMQQNKFPVNTDVAWNKVKSRMDVAASEQNEQGRIENLNRKSLTDRKNKKPMLLWAAA